MTPVIITTTVGHSSKYKDQARFRSTLDAFLHSVRRQTIAPSALIVMCHDIVPFEWPPWEHWISIDNTSVASRVLDSWTLDGKDDVQTWSVREYGTPMEDMSRKTKMGQFYAHRWAMEQGVREYWILRMDSDDLLDRRTVEFLAEDAAGYGVDAVYNRRCHVFDPTTHEIAEAHHPWSTTCNAMLFRRDKDNKITPKWDYHHYDHTKFCGDVREQGIESFERDWTLCILTNTGNNLSGRSGVRAEPYAKEPIPLTQELIDRYGLESLLGGVSPGPQPSAR